MINSIYTHKEIFLREILSNASDAEDKLAYRALTDDSVGMNRSDFKIILTPDKVARTLTVSDNGIGMTKDELEQQSGHHLPNPVLSSSSRSLKEEDAVKAERHRRDRPVRRGLLLRLYGGRRGHRHHQALRQRRGLEVALHRSWTATPSPSATRPAWAPMSILHIKPDTEDEKYEEYLEEYRIQSLVKKYSDYIHYPIKMLLHKSRQKPRPEDAGDDYKPEWEDYTEWATLNSMVPIWQKRKDRGH